MSDALRVAFLLDDTAISGTTRALLTYADALTARGHRVRIVTSAPALTWRTSRAEWIYVDELRQYEAAEGELVVTLRRPPVVVDDALYRPPVTREHEPLRVLLAGSWHLERHGVDDGYGAVAHARWFHQQLELIRVSPFAPSREEPLESVQEFHVGLTTTEMTRLMHSCDVFIAPNRAADTFALPTAEALASGLACVATAIPFHHAFDARHDFALFAPADNAVELGERLIELLGDDELRERLRARAHAVAEQWRADRAIDALLPHLRRA